MERSHVVATLVLVGVLGATASLAQPETPQPTVPERFTIEGEFVRIAYNNEGWATLGYRMAQSSIGEEHMLLEIGVTLQRGVKNQKLSPGDLSLKTPDGKIHAIMDQKAYEKAGYLRNLNTRANHFNDSINYFPSGTTRLCRIGFYGNPDRPGMGLAWGDVELSSDRACVGRIYFEIDGGIQEGQHWLVVKFDGSEIEVPFRTMTKEEEKEFRKKWKEMKKTHEDDNDG